MTNIGVALGTPDYMAPEQVRGDADIDGRCDIYSLGATLYHLLVGAPPFTGGTRAEVMSKHLTEPAPNPRKANPQTSLAAMTIIKKTMAKAPDARYTDAAEMSSAIEAALKGKSAPAATATAATKRSTTLSRARERTSKPIDKKWLYAGGAVAAVLLVGLLIALVSGQKNHPPPERRTNTAQRPPVAVGKTPAEIDAERLAETRNWAKDHPGEYDTAINRYRDAISQLTTPAIRGEAATELQALVRERAAAVIEAKAAFASAQSQTNALADNGDYDGAIALFNNLPQRHSYPLGDSVRVAAEQLKAEVEA